MPAVYARSAKISNATGRADYLKDEKRQEKIVLHKSRMEYSWEQHADFEKQNQRTARANNQALEVHIALPNELEDYPEQLEQICDELTERIVGENHDFEYAVHWNHNMTNLHVHILFSERENIAEPLPKVYKKDIWQDRDTHRLAKAGADNAELVHRKGEVQRDKDGNIRYESDIFTAKDTKFKTREWIHSKNVIVKDVLKEYGYELSITTKDSPFLAQKKLYKGASEDYIEKAKAWNNAVKDYNAAVAEHIELQPEQEPVYCEIKREVEANVKEANAPVRKITARAIELVKDMGSWVMEQIQIFTAAARSVSITDRLADSWESVKEKFYDLFDEREELTQTNRRYNRVIESLEYQRDAINEKAADVKEELDSVNAEIKSEQRKQARVIEREDDGFEL